MSCHQIFSVNTNVILYYKIKNGMYVTRTQKGTDHKPRRNQVFTPVMGRCGPRSNFINVGGGEILFTLIKNIFQKCIIDNTVYLPKCK